MFIYFAEFENKIIRTWIEHLMDNYKNIQSSTKSANIQRIAKKSRMSASSAMPVLKRGKSAPMPVYPVIFKPYYPTVYPSYIPISHDPTTHLIPISQQEYYQRFMAPLNTYSPYGYTFFPDVASSTPMNNHLKINKPFNVQVYIPQETQDEIRKYDKPEEALIDNIKELSNQNPYDFDQTLPTGFEEADEVDEIKDEINENSNPTRYGKLLDNVNSPPVPIATQLNQTTESHEDQHSLPSNIVDKLDTSAQQDKIVSPESHDEHDTQTSTSSTNGLSSSEILNGPVSQLPLDVKYSSSDKSSTTTQFSSVVSTTLEPTSTTSDADRPGTTVETQTPTTGGSYWDEERSNGEEKNQQGKPREAAEHGILSLNVTTTGISKPLNETEQKTPRIIETTQNPETLIASFTTPPTRPTTTFRSTTLCENDDCRGLKSSHLTTPSVKTTVRVNAYDIPIKTINSTAQPTTVNDEHGNRTNLVSSSVHPSSTSMTISERTTMSYHTSTPKTTTRLSSPTTPGISTPPKPSYFKMPLDKTDETQSTNLHLTSSTPRSQPLNDSTTLTLINNKINQTLSAKTNGNNYTTNIKRNADVPIRSDQSTISSSTTTVSMIPIKTVVQTNQTTVPSNLNSSSIIPLIRVQTTTEKVYSYKSDKADQSVPVTVIETIKSTSKTIGAQMKPRSSTPKTSVMVTDTMYRMSATNQDRYMAETTQSSQTTKDSDLWYSHVNTQNQRKKELNEQEVDYLLKKLIKLLKPEIEKQSLTNDSINRFITPKTGDHEKLVYIIFPMIREAAKNMNNEERRESNTSPLKNVNKK